MAKNNLDFLYGAVKLTVKTEDMVNAANDVTTKINRVKTEFDTIKNIIDGTKQYWIGDGGDANRKEYDTLKEPVQEIIKRLEEHPRDLLTMAGVYVQAENTAEQISESLSGDIIS